MDFSDTSAANAGQRTPLAGRRYGQSWRTLDYKANKRTHVRDPLLSPIPEEASDEISSLQDGTWRTPANSTISDNESDETEDGSFATGSHSQIRIILC